MTYHSELTRNLVTFSEVPWLKITMNAKKKAFSQRKLNVQKLSQCIKMTKRIRITTDLSVFCLYISKLYERCMHQQINEYFESLLSQVSMRFETKIQCATLLLVIVEKMKKSRDSNGVFGAVLTDLFKAFDCIPHGLLIAKLNAFGFNKKIIILYFFISMTENKKLR